MSQEVDNKYIQGTKTKRIKVVERSGIMLKDLIGRSDPWKNRGCTRSKCVPCQKGGGKGGDCQREGVTYSVACQVCKVISSLKKVGMEIFVDKLCTKYSMRKLGKSFPQI